MSAECWGDNLCPYCECELCECGLCHLCNAADEFADSISSDEGEGE